MIATLYEDNNSAIIDGIGLEFGLKLVRHLNFVGKLRSSVDFENI